MASCGSLQHIFEKPLPENPSNLLQSFPSWKHLPPLDQVSSVTEFFGELHFKENTEHATPVSHSAPSSSSFSIDFYSQPKSEILNGEKNEKNYTPTFDRKQYKTSNSYSSMNSESLSICTEGLGFESCKDTEDFVNNSGSKHRNKVRTSVTKHSSSGYLSGMRSRITGGELPPPISRIGRTGKPAVSFTSYRQNGRFVLKEVKLPIQESLHACREDGRLKLQYIQSDDDIIQENKDKGENIKGLEDWEDQNARNLVNGSGKAGKGINGGEIVEDEGVDEFR